MVVQTNTIDKMEKLTQEQYQYVVQLIDLFSMQQGKENHSPKRIGAAEGKFTISDDFNQHDDVIAEMFGA